MERNRLTEEQIIGVLKEAEAGAKTAEQAPRHGISEATIYNWKAKHGGMEVSEAKRLRSLEQERQAEAPAGGYDAGQRRAEGSSAQKMYGPPQPCKHFEILAAQSA